jgi:alkaline phosphatase D
MRRSTRRELIGTAALGAAALSAPPALARQLVSRRAGVGRGQFLDGVASGDPAATAATFWSRLATDNPRSGARLIVATDAGMRNVVKTRVVPTGRSINGTLKTRVGKLKPASEYFYIWESGNDVSDIGRLRTLPDPSSTQPLNIAFSSCQSYSHGFFSSHLQAAAEDLDLYIFLGDYIYAEGHRAGPGDVRTDGFDGNDLRSYRRKYRMYRSDLALRKLHTVHPTVHVWDDHEVENNYTDNKPAPSPLQRSAAYRSAFEWLPRIATPSDRFRIYRRMSLGRTAEVFLLDERQYRTVDDSDRPIRLLGGQQFEWLVNALKSSTATWKIIANSVVIAPIDYGSGPSTDSWGGYEATRAALLRELEQAGVQNVVFASGDAHVYMVNVLASDPEVFRSDPAHRPTAVEYVGGSITSPGGQRSEAEVQARNPWNRQYNSNLHGYAHMTLDSSSLVTEFRASDIARPDGGWFAFERFTQPAGTNSPTRQQLV